jgi:nitrous oxidase accessory protein NosD
MKPCCFEVAAHPRREKNVSKLLLAVAIAIVAVAGTAAGEAFGATRIVDDDGRASAPANCGAATPTFNMIEPAVEASSPGDTVNVCPGTYPEQVSVEADENGLTLRSLVFRAAVIKAPPVMTDPGDIVTINGAQNVTLRDFTVAGPLPDLLFCSLFQRTGVRVIGGGSAIIRGNRITEIRSASPALRGCQNGFAIAVGRQFEGQIGRATIFDNQLDLYQKGGIFVDNAGSSAEIRTNLVQGDGPTPIIAQNGIQISRGAVARVAANRVQDHTYSLAPATGGTGIFLSQAGATTTVSDNQAVRNDWNIFVGGTTGARILRNVLLDSTFFDGIRMSASTADNRIEDNFLRNNREHDCHDDSVGPNNPPALVANLWINNDGLTENRIGLCQPRDQEACPDDDEDDDGLTDSNELVLLTLLGNPDSDLDGTKDGNDDANLNDEDDEDEDDDDDPCRNDSDDDGVDDEDEDDDDD